MVYMPAGVVDLREIAAPATPGANLVRLYGKADGLPYTKDDQGLENGLATGTAGAIPSDHGYKGWTFEPSGSNQASGGPAAGTLAFAKVFSRGTQSITQAITYVATAGASLTNVGFALYTAAGALVQSSINTNGATAAAFQSSGLKVVTFTASNFIGPFYVAFWFTGTTIPLLERGGNIIALNNANLSAPNFRYGTANTGLTTTAPSPMGTQSGAVAQAYWVAAA